MNKKSHDSSTSSKRSNPSKGGIYLPSSRKCTLAYEEYKEEKPENDDMPNGFSQSYSGNSQQSKPNAQQIEEFEKLKLENEILHKEKELLRLEIELERRKYASLANNFSQVNKVGNISAIKALLPEFDGSTNDFNSWHLQIQAIRDAYDTIEDKLLKIIIIGKLKGCALSLIEMDPNQAKISLSELMATLQLNFSKNEERINLEYNDDLISYIKRTSETGRSLKLKEKQIVEHVISGISSDNLRDRMKQRNFNSVEALMDFAIEYRNKKSKNQNQNVIRRKIKLPDMKGEQLKNFMTTDYQSITLPELDDEENIRESTNNASANGGFDNHQQPDYRVIVEFLNTRNSCIFEAVIDTGSAVSLIREDIIKRHVRIEPYALENLYGRNYTKIRVVGIIKDYLLKISGLKVTHTFLVVPDCTMSECVLLGRDFINHPDIEVKFFQKRAYVGKKGSFLADLLSKDVYENFNLL